MDTKNMKCPKCGYKFKGNNLSRDGICPLCSQEYNTEKAMEYYRLTYGDEDSNKNKKSKQKVIRDWIIFCIAFVAFIIIMQYLITYIANA